MKKFTLYTLIFTVSCFSASIILGKISEKNQDTKYWNLAAKAYSGHLNQDYKSRNIKKEINASQLNTLEIHGISTDIKIEKSNDHQIHIIYSDKSSQTDKLTDIDFVKQDKNSFLIDFKKIIENEKGKNIKLNMTSLFNFNIELEDAKATIQIPSEISNVLINTVSGDIEVTQDIILETFKLKSVSGDLEFNFNNHLKNSIINTISGDILLKLESEPHLELSFKSATGELEFDTNLETSLNNHLNKLNDSKSDKQSDSISKLILGNGKAKLNIESVSGDVEITK